MTPELAIALAVLSTIAAVWSSLWFHWERRHKLIVGRLRQNTTPHPYTHRIEP